MVVAECLVQLLVYFLQIYQVGLQLLDGLVHIHSFVDILLLAIFDIFNLPASFLDNFTLQLLHFFVVFVQLFFQLLEFGLLLGLIRRLLLLSLFFGFFSDCLHSVSELLDIGHQPCLLLRCRLHDLLKLSYFVD